MTESYDIYPVAFGQFLPPFLIEFSPLRFQWYVTWIIQSGMISIPLPKELSDFARPVVMRVKFFVISPFPQVALITGLDLVLGEAYTVEWDLITEDIEKIDCYPDQNGASKEKCIARGCAWEVKMLMMLS